ncbi:PREDICTED: myb-like protein I [Tarenaya hassleriana]|uniref:myb-like protein I n=1 Tax=Tarenaya hassleriana TaxID=28532 RepID=UPI00053C93D5|nr:PREDICTED: myb-like protein I [Tarenaya hassleriana]XP_010537287.1 PREDICTED: myb-like protein I [Tarenaya hassleriana]
MSENTEPGQIGDTREPFRGGVKIFGVYLTEETKQVRDGDNTVSSVGLEDSEIGSCDCEPPLKRRNKGVIWTEEEHQLFLEGLEKLGKGDWKGIATRYVKTRSSTQVASHAQKHFIRQEKPDQKKQRRSIFDTPFCSETRSPRDSEVANPSGGTPSLPQQKACVSTSGSTVTTNNGINSYALPMWPRPMGVKQVNSLEYMWGYPCYRMFEFMAPFVPSSARIERRH